MDVALHKNGGANCGWDPADHKDFLRIRTKHSNKTNTLGFFQELARAVPGLDEAFVREHVVAYERYLDLCETKKGILASYKEAKRRAEKQY